MGRSGEWGMDEHRVNVCVCMFQMLRSWPGCKEEFTLDGWVTGEQVNR